MEEPTRLALWLLLPFNTVALATGLAITNGAVVLPAPPAPLEVAAPATPATPAPVEQRAQRAHPTVWPKALPSRVARREVKPARPVAREPARRSGRAATGRVPQRPFEQEVRRQVRRLPRYRPGVARWVVIPNLATYGMASLRTGTIYLSPRIPRRLLYSVVAHEWGHVISSQGYSGDLAASQQAFRRWFGGSARTAIERVADCIALLLGATWTHYTSCADKKWRRGARYLALGRPLPSR